MAKWLSEQSKIRRRIYCPNRWRSCNSCGRKSCIADVHVIILASLEAGVENSLLDHPEKGTEVHVVHVAICIAVE